MLKLSHEGVKEFSGRSLSRERFDCDVPDLIIIYQYDHYAVGLKCVPSEIVMLLAPAIAHEEEENAIGHPINLPPPALRGGKG